MKTLEKIKAEIEKYKTLIDDKILDNDDLIIGERNACNHILRLLDTLQEPEDCWLFTLQNSNMQIFNCFFVHFPNKRDLQKAAETDKYAILNVTRLNKEQCNKLLGEED